ncbi:MAG: Gfo/Idh/MocA family oxidoreductase, partial [Oscillospiraceae bacterium]|nr:Gfo/Idh/MocA family oxidoreductase [Candidatus Equicaccousia limihippi]
MKIGVIGAENPHSIHFCMEVNGANKYPGVKIAYLYGADAPEMAKELSEKYDIELCDSEEEVIEKSDGVVITYRCGSRHFEPAMKVLKAKKPLYNDKPFTCDLKQCLELTDYARNNSVLVAGGSTLKSLPELSKAAQYVKSGSTAVVSYAANWERELDGYWFYGMHGIEVCIQLCGEDFKSVNSFKNGNTIVTTITYDDKTCILCNSPDMHDLKISVANGTDINTVDVLQNHESIGPAEFVKMLQTKKMPRALTHYEKSVELASKIIESVENFNK